jgi:hypothetical protein
MEIVLTRRQLLGRTAWLPLAVPTLPLLVSCTESTQVCADPETLGAGELQMRKTLEYVDLTPHAAQRCDNCEFFRAGSGTDAACGGCEILAGAVNRQGYCTSWAGRS